MCQPWPSLTFHSVQLVDHDFVLDVGTVQLVDYAESGFVSNHKVHFQGDLGQPTCWTISPDIRLTVAGALGQFAVCGQPGISF
eukprot:1312672-Amphidinium_carterae.1